MTPGSGTSRPELLDQLREQIRLRHYSIRTETQYAHWVRRFVLFHGKRHPRDMEAQEVEAFLAHLALAGRIAAATQNQALSALLFLYREVLGQDLPWMREVVRAKRPARLPVVLTQREVASVLERMVGLNGLMARLLYGTGMRLMECVRLRVKDVDFERAELLVRDGKGGKDRVTMLPQTLVAQLQEHLRWCRRLYEDDLAKGMAAVSCRMRWNANIPRPVPIGAGNTYFRPAAIPSTRAAGWSAATTSMKRCCSAR